MAYTRRELMQRLGSLSLAGALSGVPGRAAAAVARTIPWRNWSGAQVCYPAARVAPASEDELAQLIRSASGTLRAVGSGHSFSPLVPTEGTMVSLANLSGMIASDTAQLQSEFWAGTRIADMGDPLKAAGLALPNMADIDYQTLAGAIATSTHGTGLAYGSYASQVLGLRLITASGEVIDCDAQHHPEIYNAARVSLGALGMVTRVRLQNRKAFRVHRREWVQKTDELLEQWPQLIKDNQHFEMNVLVHSNVALACAINETQDPHTQPQEGGGDGPKVRMLEAADRWFGEHPATEAWMLDHIARWLDFPEIIDDSYKVFANVRDMRFNEMEYEIPAEHGVECLREVIARINQRNLRTFIPIEFRYVRADDIWLSMFEGRDACAISVHQYHELDYHNLFSQVEPIFLKYGGRPHWGKLHHLRAPQLSALYPRMKDFLEVRAALDPKGKFLNEHLRSVFGLNGC